MRAQDPAYRPTRYGIVAVQDLPKGTAEQ